MKVKKKKQLNFLDKFLLGISVLLGLSLLISYLAPITDPQKFWPIAFFGLAYPLLLLANLIVTVYWLLRRSKCILVPLLCILVGWGVLRDNFGFRFSESVTDAVEPNSSLVLMTYNAHSFKRYGEKNDSTTRHQMLELINDQRPDIIGIQEFYTKNRGQYALKDSMKQIMGSDACYFEPFNFDKKGEAMGIAIFSKYPIINKGSILLSEQGSGNQCIYVDVKKNAQTFRFYSIHLQSIRFEPDDYDYLAKFSQKGDADITSSKRIGGKLKRAFMKRSEQVFKIKNHAKHCPYPYIIAGDFNDTPSSYAVNQMAKGLKNAFREKGSGFARTYNGSFPNYQIDYIMVSPVINVTNYHIVQKKLSDHYPVCSKLQLQ
ncbi:endonuclease/exonuclease/phosphatase family protein [Mucilaginibacter terrae]|uniref:endonuclease/exonuclease/phosphatase family protein n=1 Tax=Mucilaginibacter terrae TaxID=1955052 RepID=UPI003632F39F